MEKKPEPSLIVFLGKAREIPRTYLADRWWGPSNLLVLVLAQSELRLAGIT